MKFRLLIFLAVTLLLGSVFAQLKVVPNYNALEVERGSPGGELTLPLDNDPPSFFYYGEVNSNSQTLAQQLFDGLVEFNLETYELEPALAESWDISEDGTVYTFSLREGVTWHDGEPFTADDVIFTYEQVITNPEARAGDAAQFTFNIDGEDQTVVFEKVDDLTVRMTLPTASAAFLLQQRFFIMPKHKLLEYSVEGGAEAADINNAWMTDGTLSDVVGTGPFTLSDYMPGQRVTLRKNLDYWKEDSAGTRLPYAETLSYLIIRGAEAQLAQFLAGNLDALNISGAQFPDLKTREVEGAAFRVVQSEALFGSPPHLAFNFNAADPDLAEVFSNLDFRKAMQSAVDRQRIIETVYNGLATLPGTPTAPADGTFYSDTTELLGTFDLEVAAQQLEDMGLTDSDGDGVRNISEGKQLEFGLTYSLDSATAPAIVTILQNDFAQIGVKVNLVGVQASTLLSTGLAGDFDAIILAFDDQPDPELRKPIWQPGGALYYWHRATRPAEDSVTANLEAMTEWEQRIYEIFDEAATLNDQEARVELYNEWQQLNAENLPVIMIVKPVDAAAVYNRVGNFVYSLGVTPGYNPVPLYFVRQ